MNFPCLPLVRLYPLLPDESDSQLKHSEQELRLVVW